MIGTEVKYAMAISHPEGRARSTNEALYDYTAGHQHQRASRRIENPPRGCTDTDLYAGGNTGDGKVAYA